MWVGSMLLFATAIVKKCSRSKTCAASLYGSLDAA